MLNQNQIEEYKDSFNIYNLITKINPFYKLVFDKKLKCFYIINSAKNNQICLKFNNFSLNIIKNLQMTRIERSYEIFQFIDDFNQKLEDKNKEKASIRANDSLKHLISYSKRINSISKNDINRIIRGNYA